MTVNSRAARREARHGRAKELFGADADAALDLLELVELAWHDCYGEVSPSEQVVDDILVCSEGELPLMVRASRWAVKDFRDLRMWADKVRADGSDVSVQGRAARTTHVIAA